MRLISRILSKKPTIFVQIASYRDPECQWTVKELFEQAAHPERIHIGICWQFDREADKACFTEPSPRPNQTRVVLVDAKDSQGVCWARAQAQSLYRGEDYVLMIDSHMRFVKDWDERMIEELNLCPTHKALLTHYPPGYKPPRQISPNPRVSVQILKPFSEQGEVRGDGIALETAPPHPLRGAFIACGFIFARGRLVEEVPYDPYLYFNQEEITLAARFYTHGWDVYHPHRVLLFHYYRTPEDKGTMPPLHWEDHKDWSERQELGRQRFHHMVGHAASADPKVTKNLDRYGLGKTRTLASFEAWSGVDFSSLTTSERAQQALFVERIHTWKRKMEMVLQPVAPAQGQTKDRAPLSALATGDFLPPVMLPCSDGTLHETQLYAGKLCVLCYLPVEFDAYLKEFFAAISEKIGALHQRECQVILVIQGDVQKARTIYETYRPHTVVLADETGAFAAALGHARYAQTHPLTVVLDANQKILCRLEQRNAINHLGDIVRAVQAQPVAMAYDVRGLTAPVLMIPDAMTPELCETVLRYWRQGEQYAGTLGAGAAAVVVPSGKRRTDVNIVDRELLTAIDQQLSKTVLPELRKVGAFEAMYRERYKIGCYRADDAGYYHQHRDTGVPELSHRRYSMSLGLNDAYEGGQLHFPEYGGALYRPAKGMALLFPSALLHGVHPVTQGERLVMVSFFHGSFEEAYRKDQLLARGEIYNEDDVRMLVQARFDGVTQSQHFYTSSTAARLLGKLSE